MPSLKLPANYYKTECYWAHMLTFRCTSACPFCILNGRGRRRDATELSGREILRFWNGLEHAPGQRLSLIGGEPMLHPDIVEIINGLKGYYVTVTTNCKGPFYKQPNFARLIKPRANKQLRINTTFHPQLMTAKEYVSTVEQWRAAGHFVDQISYVNHPEIAKHARAIEEVRKTLRLKDVPYLGFYDAQDGFCAAACPQHIEPNEQYYKPDAPAKQCGLTDLNAYRHLCGSHVKLGAQCAHPSRSLIIGPAGNYYHCHYKLYYGIDPVCNIRQFQPVTPAARDCRHYGFCNWCDVPRVTCSRNPTAKPLTLTKLYDKREEPRSEIKFMTARIAAFAKQHKLEFNRLKWFEYAYLLLYSGHRHRGKVLEVGSAKSVLPYFLASEGYDVTIMDVDDLALQRKLGAKFGVKSLQGDMRKPQTALVDQFDLISCLSVVEHVDQDTKAVLNLAKCLRRGGILVISTDFFTQHLEYPDANRTIVTDRPAGSHTDSRTYTPATFEARILEPLEAAGLSRLGVTNWQNVNLADPVERSVRGLYTFGVTCLRRGS
jgi:2-polyprenyl-3-methyl-5-hydroxy-6-metoxy-1,4-benzoquinol methylase/organic radical activating enzyme